MHLTFRHFELVEAIHNCGTLVEAAKILGISQPALSNALQALEAQIGEILFDRSVKPLRPNRFARVFIERGKQITIEKTEILRDISRLNGLESGRLTVAASMYGAQSFAEQAIARVVKLYPQLQITLLQGNWLEVTKSVLQGKIDLALAEFSYAQTLPELATELVNNDPCYFFCRAGHPLTQQKSVTWTDLNAYPYADTRLADRFTSGLSEAGIILGEYDPVDRVTIPKIWVETFSALKQIIKNSDAIGSSRPLLLKDDLASGELVLLDVGPHPWLVEYLGFIYRKDRHLSPALKMFMETVRAIEQENRDQ
jgi:DNA-binding transcriptional LysR family regulator